MQIIERSLSYEQCIEVKKVRRKDGEYEKILFKEFSIKGPEL